MTTPGICRFCGCSEFDACASNCAWVDREATLCTECLPAARAEAEELHALRKTPGLAAAFHRGFVVGWFDVRRQLAVRHGKGNRVARSREEPEPNPYLAATYSRAWLRGLEGGRIARAAFLRQGGTIDEQPREFIYRREAA